jgi:hypothetical protein
VLNVILLKRLLGLFSVVNASAWTQRNGGESFRDG